MKTYKDIVFWSVVIAWTIMNFVLLFKDAIYNIPVVNFTVIAIMAVLIVLKNTNKKFNNWLNKKIQKL